MGEQIVLKTTVGLLISLALTTGAFGTYIDKSSAISISMLPALPLDRRQQVGNAAAKAVA